MLLFSGVQAPWERVGSDEIVKRRVDGGLCKVVSEMDIEAERFFVTENKEQRDYL